MNSMPKKKVVTKKTVPAKKRAVKKVVPQVETPKVETLSKKQRMAMAMPQRTWANVQETEFEAKSWKDWTAEKLGLNKIK